MSDAFLAELPESVAAALHAALPDLRECAAHDGRFDLAEVKAFAARAPAVRVSLLRLEPGARLGGPAVQRQAVMAAFVVTRDAPALKRGAAAAAVAQRVVQVVEGNRWRLDACGAAHSVEAENLYTEKVREQGVALWAVSWRQPVQLEAAPPEPLAPGLYVGMAPLIGAAHEDDYVLYGEVPPAPPEPAP